MEDHQFYNTPALSVEESLSSLTTLHPSLTQLGALPCVVLASRDPRKVALVSGGGAGHEPAHGGYLGAGMLTGAVSGQVFASPASALVLELLLAVTGQAGCLVIVKNYTGDCLNFGLAVEKARRQGLKVEMVVCGDDHSLLHQDTLAGPRGLCGVLFIHKVAGAFAAQGASLEAVYSVAQLVNRSIGTAGVAVSPCVPPGCVPSFSLPPNTMEFGVGLHGEPGVLQCGSLECRVTVEKLFGYLADTRGLALKAGDDVAIIVNNLGGTSELEMGVVTQEVVKWCELNEVNCHVLFAGTFMTSLGMHGVSLSALRLDPEGRLIELLKYPTSAPYWREGVECPKISKDKAPFTPSIRKFVSTNPKGSKTFQKVLEVLCTDMLSKVNELNELDRISGDGDCGTTVEGVASKLRATAHTLDYSRFSGILTQLADTVEAHMGGTSGALYTIGLTAAASQAELCEGSGSATTGVGGGSATTGVGGGSATTGVGSGSATTGVGGGSATTGEGSGSATTVDIVDITLLTQCLEAAVSAVARYGRAQEGDSTMLDVLHPVLRVLQLNHHADMTTLAALVSAAADTGVMKTATLRPRAGRASYIRAESTAGAPDPGAVCTASWVKSVCKVLYAGHV